MLIPLHLGSLHPMEQALTLVLAFGPFILLGIVIAVRRRQDRAAEQDLEQQHEQREPHVEAGPDPQRER